MKEYQLLYNLMKLFGLISQICDKIKKAIEAFEVLRDIAFELGNHKLIMESYKLYGQMLQRDKRYDHAAVCFKNMMVCAWYYNEKQWEITAY